MARRRENKAANEARGRRLATIREALGLSQELMAPRLNEAAKRLGLPETYKYYTVSRIESGSISFEDAAVWLAVAPKEMKLTWEWLVFGPPLKATLAADTRKKKAG